MRRRSESTRRRSHRILAAPPPLVLVAIALAIGAAIVARTMATMRAPVYDVAVVGGGLAGLLESHAGARHV